MNLGKAWLSKWRFILLVLPNISVPNFSTKNRVTQNVGIGTQDFIVIRA